MCCADAGRPHPSQERQFGEASIYPTSYSKQDRIDVGNECNGVPAHVDNSGKAGTLPNPRRFSGVVWTFARASQIAPQLRGVTELSSGLRSQIPRSTRRTHWN